MLFHMAEYCGTPQAKARRNSEYKVCLHERAILRLLDKSANEVPFRRASYTCTSTAFHKYYDYVKIFKQVVR